MSETTTSDVPAEVTDLQEALHEAKNGSSGIIAEARAAAERNARHTPEATPVPEAQSTLALRALELANEQGEAPEVTAQRAAIYLAFLKENNGG